MVTSSILDITNTITSGVRGNTSTEQQWLANAPPEMRQSMIAQLQMQKEQELVEAINKMMKQVNETEGAITRNIGT